MFDEVNQDAYRGTHDEGSAAPLMGFMDAFDASWAAQTKVRSLLAVQQNIRAAEQDQIKRIQDAGLRPPKSLDDSEDIGSGPFGGAQFYQGRYAAAAQSIMDGGGWYTDEMVAERDKQLDVLKKEHPELGIKSYAEMFDTVRQQAQERETKANGSTTTLGAVGGFVGGALGSMDPRSDPLSAAAGIVTAPLGGPTAIARMATQGAVQAGTEAANIAAGPDNNNILLGRPTTVGEELGRVGTAGAGGVIGQAIGEGVAMGARKLATGKWFADVPPPKVPEQFGPAEHFGPFLQEGEVPGRMTPGRPINDYPDWETFADAHGLTQTPYGNVREAALRTATDTDHVARELDKWDGPQPWEVQPPRTDTAVVREPAPGVVYDSPYQKYLDSLENVDDIARRIDPDLFRQYDALAATRQQTQAILDQAAKRFAQFQGPETFFERSTALHENRQAMLRAEIQAADQKMRDLAPLVTRAYAAAEKEWRTTPMDWNTLAFMKRLEDQTGFRWREPTAAQPTPSLTEQPPRIAPRTAPVTQRTTLVDAVPLARVPPELEARVKLDANADAPTRVAAVVAEDMKRHDEHVDGFVKQVAAIAKMADKDIDEETARLTESIAGLKKINAPAEAIAAREKALDELQYVTMPDGSKLHMTQDRVPFVDEDGTAREMNVRDFLREMHKDQQALQSVISCSRPG